MVEGLFPNAAARPHLADRQAGPAGWIGCSTHWDVANRRCSWGCQALDGAEGVSLASVCEIWWGLNALGVHDRTPW